MHSKTQNKASYNTTTLFLICLTSLAMIKKRSKRRLKKEIFIIVKNIARTKIGLLLVISENFLSTIRKNNVLIILYFLLKSKGNYFQNFLITKYLRQVNQTHFSYRNCFSIFVLRWDLFRLIKNRFIKIKKQLMLTNFTLVVCKIEEKINVWWNTYTNLPLT